MVLQKHGSPITIIIIATLQCKTAYDFASGPNNNSSFIFYRAFQSLKDAYIKHEEGDDNQGGQGGRQDNREQKQGGV